jgi:hypothetical protein
VLDRLRALLSSRTDVSETLALLDLDAYALDAALRKALKLFERWRIGVLEAVSGGSAECKRVGELVFFKSALDGVVRDFLIESTVTEVSLTSTRLSRTDEQPFESSGQTIP